MPTSPCAFTSPLTASGRPFPSARAAGPVGAVATIAITHATGRVAFGTLAPGPYPLRGPLAPAGCARLR